MLTALIISTYNWPSALKLCLEHVLFQTLLPDMVIIADDGSGEQTKEMVRQIAKSFPVPLHHVWQEDKGFRLSRIRNLALAKATALGAEYIIQIDGDILLERHFIEDHLSEAKPSHLLCGSRAYLSPRKSHVLLQKGKATHLSYFTPSVVNRLNALRWPWLSQWIKKNKRHLGCNMSYFLSDAIVVNGYDEDFEGWGAEDDDFYLRMEQAGIKPQRIKFKAVCFHLYHKSNARDENYEQLEQKKKNYQSFCLKGLKQHLSTQDDQNTSTSL
ncbi:MAG: glycosyltransferase family 2 protein [Bacteroidaceae bacterium]|nr:glycosyltransferase family 2 protein [Bacteroidaceae bacterium]